MVECLDKSGLVPKDQPCMSSHTCKLSSGAAITCGDVVFLHVQPMQGSPPLHAAQVHAFFSLDFGQVAFVEKYCFQETIPSQYCSKWLVSSPRTLDLVPLENISCAVAYHAAKGKVTCLTPAFLRFWKNANGGSCISATVSQACIEVQNLLAALVTTCVLSLTGLLFYI